MFQIEDSHDVGYLERMSTYSVAQARDNLSKLITAAERGEDVRIQRNGRPAVRLVGDASKGLILDVAEMKRRRIVPKAGPTDIVAMLEEMRQDRPW